MGLNNKIQKTLQGCQNLEVSKDNFIVFVEQYLPEDDVPKYSCFLDQFSEEYDWVKETEDTTPEEFGLSDFKDLSLFEILKKVFLNYTFRAIDQRVSFYREFIFYPVFQLEDSLYVLSEITKEGIYIFITTSEFLENKKQEIKEVYGNFLGDDFDSGDYLNSKS